MMFTLLLIKPNATKKDHIGEILGFVEKHGFKIEAMRMFRMDDDLAARFYATHKGKEFYDRLVRFMTSGQTVGVVLSRNEAVHTLRDIVGNTDPAEAAPGTLRHRFGETVTWNAVHASDTPEHAITEIGILFPSFQFSV